MPKNLNGTSLLINLYNKGELLASKSIKYTEKGQNIDLIWIVNKSKTEIDLTSDYLPTLFGYGLELLPLSPNPDEALFG